MVRRRTPKGGLVRTVSNRPAGGRRNRGLLRYARNDGGNAQRRSLERHPKRIPQRHAPLRRDGDGAGSFHATNPAASEAISAQRCSDASRQMRPAFAQIEAGTTEDTSGALARRRLECDGEAI